MKRNGRTRTAILRDLGRLVAPLDVLYQVGNMIYRRSLRYTLLTAGIGIIGMTAGFLDLPGLSVTEAIMLPLIVGAVALVGGYAMKLVPRLISTRLLTVAQACGLNLMEDYRKFATDEHLAVLWDRLFRHEAGLRMTAGLPPIGGAMNHHSDDDSLQSAHEVFLDRAMLSLRSPLPQTREMHLTGLDLRYFEDWRDGAYLDQSDTKLVEQFEGNITLLAARREVNLVGLAAMGRFMPRQIMQKLWFFFIMRSVAIEVGLCVQGLNKQYDTDAFNSQAFLWPGEEDQGWLDQFDGARRAIVERRQRMIRRVFGPDHETATAMLDHMLYCPLLLAGELRMRYDPDYCTGRTLGYNVVSDMKAANAMDEHVSAAQRFAQAATQDIDACDKLIAAHRPELLEPRNALTRRAVQIALHVNRRKLRRALGGAIPADMSAERFDTHVAPIVDDAGTHPCRTNHRLVAVRMHHELARLTRSAYRKLLKDLAYSDESAAES